MLIVIISFFEKKGLSKLLFSLHSHLLLVCFVFVLTYKWVFLPFSLGDISSNVSSKNNFRNNFDLQDS